MGDNDGRIVIMCIFDIYILNTKEMKLILPILFLILAILFAITAFESTMKSEGLLFAIAMQAIPVAGCVLLTILAYKERR